MICTVSCAALALRSTQNTCAPSRAKVTAVALPLPQPGPIEPAPTTIAVLPLSLGIEVSFPEFVDNRFNKLSSFRDAPSVGNCRPEAQTRNLEIPGSSS